MYVEPRAGCNGSLDCALCCEDLRSMYEYKAWNVATSESGSSYTLALVGLISFIPLSFLTNAFSVSGIGGRNYINLLRKD
jgi:hypothetical protein